MADITNEQKQRLQDLRGRGDSLNDEEREELKKLTSQEGKPQHEDKPQQGEG